MCVCFLVEASLVVRFVSVGVLLCVLFWSLAGVIVEPLVLLLSERRTVLKLLNETKAFIYFHICNFSVCLMILSLSLSLVHLLGPIPSRLCKTLSLFALFSVLIRLLLPPSLFSPRFAIGRTKCNLSLLLLSLWFMLSKICLMAVL